MSVSKIIDLHRTGWQSVKAGICKDLMVTVPQMFVLCEKNIIHVDMVQYSVQRNQLLCGSQVSSKPYFSDYM